MGRFIKRILIGMVVMLVLVAFLLPAFQTDGGIRDVLLFGLIIFWPLLTIVALVLLSEFAQRNWQFSLRTLIIAMTLIAVILGLAAWVARK